MSNNDKKRSYKKFLQSGEFADVSRGTLRRTAIKKCRMRNTLLSNSSNDVTEAKNANVERTENNCIVITGEEQDKQEGTSKYNNYDINYEADNIQDDSVNMIRPVHDQSTQWEIPVDNDSSDTDNDECEADYSEKNLSRCTNFNDLLSNPKFLETITTSVDKSPGEVFLMLLKFTLLHKLPLTYTSDLFRLVNCMFKESILPESSYMINKLLNAKSNIEFHGICPNCKICVGKIETFKGSAECDICSFNIDLSKPSLENIFLVIDPSEDIANCINLHSTYYNYVINERKYDGSIKDIYDGKLYREFVSNLQYDKSSYVTGILNTDGAPTFECSNYSIWPVYMVINEIPVASRLKSSIVCGIWFGKKETTNEQFLQPLVNKLNELSSKGIECKINNVARIITLHILIICVDSVARAPMQCHKQFNGKYGCSWCLHPGEWFAGSMRYPIVVPYPIERSQDETVRFMQMVTENEDGEDYYGVKSVSPLINLKGFDIIRGFVPDYMHCYLAGVGKQITECILKTKSVEVLVIDKLLKSLQVPQQLARFTRPLSDRNDWKAKEWENFILHYSVPLFKYLLEDEIVEYWALLVNSLYILLKDSITVEELDYADEMLHEFNIKTEKLFTKKAMTFNIHQFLHISASVHNWGPLWSHSTFPFENANHQLLQTIHCANGVNLQIVRYLNYQKCLNILENHIYPHASPKVIQFCEHISKKRIKKSNKINNVTYLGNTLFIDPEILNNLNLSKKSTVYTRVVINGCLYAAENKKSIRCNNSYCQLVDGTFRKILYFVVDHENKKEVILCNRLRNVNKLSCSIFSFDSIINDITVTKIEDIKIVCVFLCVGKLNYISVLSNVYHY